MKNSSPIILFKETQRKGWLVSELAAITWERIYQVPNLSTAGWFWGLTTVGNKRRPAEDAEKAHKEIAGMLLQKGADVNSR